MLENNPLFTHIRFNSGIAAREVALRNRSKINAAFPVIKEIMTPVDDENLEDVIETLSQVYFERVRDDEQFDLWFKAYQRALGGWPAHLLWLACDRWISDGAARFPTPSDLKRIVQAEYSKMYAALYRARSAYEWLADNPDLVAFKPSEKSRKMTKRLAGAVAEIAEKLARDELPSPEAKQELALHQGHPIADDVSADLSEARAARRAYQKHRAEKFLAENKPSGEIELFKSKWGA